MHGGTTGCACASPVSVTPNSSGASRSASRGPRSSWVRGGSRPRQLQVRLSAGGAARAGRQQTVDVRVSLPNGRAVVVHYRPLISAWTATCSPAARRPCRPPAGAYGDTYPGSVALRHPHHPQPWAANPSGGVRTVPDQPCVRHGLEKRSTIGLGLQRRRRHGELNGEFANQQGAALAPGAGDAVCVLGQERSMM